jgi:hypothetical protein
MVMMLKLRLLNAKTIFDNDNDNGNSLQSNLHYHSDDELRTLMSGQVVLRGLLQEELNQFYAAHTHYHVLNVRTANKGRGILMANVDICPGWRKYPSGITNLLHTKHLFNHPSIYCCKISN